MSESLTLFDLAEAKLEASRGMEQAADAQVERLALARRMARTIAERKPDRTCTAHEVRKMWVDLGMGEWLGNAAGSLFLRSEWEFTGRRVPSEVVGCHGHQNPVWRLK